MHFQIALFQIALVAMPVFLSRGRELRVEKLYGRRVCETATDGRNVLSRHVCMPDRLVGNPKILLSFSTVAVLPMHSRAKWYRYIFVFFLIGRDAEGRLT